MTVMSVLFSIIVLLLGLALLWHFLKATLPFIFKTIGVFVILGVLVGLWGSLMHNADVSTQVLIAENPDGSVMVNLK